MSGREQAMQRIEPLRAVDLPDAAWRGRVAIRFGHCDPAGIVYTPAYFDLFNGVIENWYGEALGLDYYALLRDRRLGLGYGHAACDFFLPSTMGDRLEVAVLVERIGGASLTIVLHAMKGGLEAVRARFVTVTTALDSGIGVVVPIPPDLRDALEAYRVRCGAAPPAI